MRTYVVCLVLLLPLLLFAAPFQVISESKDVLELSFRLPNYTLENVKQDANTWQKIVCEEGSITSKDGYPELLGFSVPVAVPVDGNYSIVVESAKSITQRGVFLQPSYTMVMNGEDIDYKRILDFEAYNKTGLYPVENVVKGEEAFIGNRKFIPLIIQPFQYDAKSRALQVTTELKLRIVINGTKTASRNWQTQRNPLDDSGSAFFINEVTSKEWRLEKTRDTSYQAPKSGSSGVNEVQLIVDTEGIYKVSYSYLMNVITGMADSLQLIMDWTPASVDPRYLELSDEYGQVPIHFVGENDGTFDVNDYFEFYGDRHSGDHGYMDDYTAENVYTLKRLDRLGARMVVENGGLVVSDVPQSSKPDAYQETVHFEQQLVMDKLGNGWSQNNDFSREDIWFWKKINAPNLDIIPVELQYPKDDTILHASAKVSLMGLTYYSGSLGSNQYDHDASVRLNQAMIDSHSWKYQNEQLFENQSSIPNNFLRHGVNNFYISLSGNTVMGEREQVMLDYAEVTYWREYKTNSDIIKFTKPSNANNSLMQFALQGFSSPNVSVYKIGSSVFNNLQVEPFTVDGAAPWTVTLQDSVSSTSVKYYAVSEAQKRIPKYARLNIPSDLRNPNNHGNVLVISTPTLAASAGTQQLLDNWSSEGHSSTIVYVQDIYDEFNAGIVSADAIKEFIKYAYNNWSEPQISHVVLLGEGVDDTRDNSLARMYNVVPVKKIWTFQVGAIASDNWYACIVGNDPLPDVAISRIGVWTDQQIQDYANKATSYRVNLQTSKLWNSHVTLTAGGKITDTNDVFAQQSEYIRRRSVPQDYRVSRVYTNTQTVSGEYFGGATQLKEAFNSGTKYLQFMGHGGGRVWADYNLFGFNDVASLNNTVYPIVVSLACYASAFDTNGTSSISEAFVLQPNKGAIGTAGFSGLGYLVQDVDWGLAYTDALFNRNFNTVGDAWMYTLAKFYTVTVSKQAQFAMTNGAVYLGDPLIRMRKPVTGIPVAATNPVLNAGETLHVTATFPQDVEMAKLYITKENEKTINIPVDRPVVNGHYTADWTNSNSSATNYTRKIYVAGYSPTQEYIGKSIFSVGKPNVMHLQTSPVEPTWRDSVSFSARVFSPEPVTSLICRVRLDSTWVSIPMQKSDADSTLFNSVSKYPNKKTNKEVYFKYILNTTHGYAESYLGSYIIRGPELTLRDIKYEQSDSAYYIKVLGANVGNASSVATDISLFYGPPGASFSSMTFLKKQTYSALANGQERWESIPITGLQNGNYKVQARVDSLNMNQEWSPYDSFVNDPSNYIDFQVSFNNYLVGNGGGDIVSLDNNVSCNIPAGLISSGTAIFEVAALSPRENLNQPDVKPVLLKSVDTLTLNQSSVPYQLSCTPSSLLNATGQFINDKELELTMFYHPTDTATQAQEGNDSYKIYRYNDEYKKWMYVGGFINTTLNSVTVAIDRPGVYSLFRNTDTKVPTIDVNVQDQEFTIGGYIAGNGVISILLSDDNGINVIDDTVVLSMNGVVIPKEDYVMSVNMDNINRVPIKYQLAVGNGEHELKVDCRDLNNKYNTRDIKFIVNDDFNITNVANYPNPVLGKAVEPKNDGRTRFTYVLTDGADDITIKVFTISGRLVKTFRNLPTGVGYHEYPRTLYGWDCKDEQGYPLANGTYFYRVIAKKGDKTIEKTQKMAILK